MIVWDAHTLAQLFVYNIGVTVKTSKFSKDNSMIAIGFTQNDIHILNAVTYAVINNTIDTAHVLV